MQYSLPQFSDETVDNSVPAELKSSPLFYSYAQELVIDLLIMISTKIDNWVCFFIMILRGFYPLSEAAGTKSPHQGWTLLVGEGRKKDHPMEQSVENRIWQQIYFRRFSDRFSHSSLFSGKSNPFSNSVLHVQKVGLKDLIDLLTLFVSLPPSPLRFFQVEKQKIIAPKKKKTHLTEICRMKTVNTSNGPQKVRLNGSKKSLLFRGQEPPKFLQTVKETE